MEWWKGKGTEARETTQTSCAPQPAPYHPRQPTSHIPHPQARMQRVGPRWRGGGKGTYPCRAGPGALQSRAVAAGPRWVTEFRSPDFDNPQHPKIKASPRKKRGSFPLPFQGPREGGWAEIRILGGWPWADPGGCSKRWGPGSPQARPALTKQLSMEQETRAVRLMVAGGLGQRTCPRSRCAARQSRALAASRLRGSPGAAAAARRRARWRWGLRATPARLSPPFHNGASSAPPSRTSAGGRGARGVSRTARGSQGRGGPRSPAHSPRPLPPRSPSAAWEGVLWGRLGAFRNLGYRTVPRLHERGRRKAYIFSLPIFSGEPPHTRFHTSVPTPSPPEFPQCRPKFPRWSSPTSTPGPFQFQDFLLSLQNHQPTRPLSITVLQHPDLTKAHPLSAP